MDREGIKVVETAVGDRYVLEAMRDGGYVLGGEQSGHLLLLDRATTGDGLLTALTLLGRVASSGRSLADLASVVDRLPQVLINVPVSTRLGSRRLPAWRPLWPTGRGGARAAAAGSSSARAAPRTWSA